MVTLRLNWSYYTFYTLNINRDIIIYLIKYIGVNPLRLGGLHTKTTKKYMNVCVYCNSKFYNETSRYNAIYNRYLQDFKISSCMKEIFKNYNKFF